MPKTLSFEANLFGSQLRQRDRLLNGNAIVETEEYTLIHNELAMGQSLTQTFDKLLVAVFNIETPIRLTINGLVIDKTVVGLLVFPMAGTLYVNNPALTGSVVPYKIRLVAA
jgi:hypothetical protein